MPSVEQILDGLAVENQLQIKDLVEKAFNKKQKKGQKIALETALYKKKEKLLAIRVAQVNVKRTWEDLILKLKVSNI